MTGVLVKVKLCEVCEKQERIGVAAIPMTPFSAGYCQDCLKEQAYPWNILVANTLSEGGLDQCHPEWIEMIENTCKHLGRSMDDFKADLRELNCRVTGEFPVMEG